MWTRILAVSLTAVAVSSAHAAPATNSKSANFMLPECKRLLDQPPRMTPMAGMCGGIVEALTAVGKMMSGPQKSCAPDGVTPGQAIRVVVKFIEERPERMHEDFKKLTMEA